MIETRGRTSWVEINIAQVVEMALKLNASGVCLVHNHPRSIKESPNLKPSNADIASLRELATRLDDTGLAYFGNWIVSNGHIAEILHTIQSKRSPEFESPFSDKEVATLLTPYLANVIHELTKTALLQIDWYNISEKYILESKLEFTIKRFTYWGQEGESWVFSISVKNNEGRTSGAALSIEQAIKAHDAIIELQSISEKLSGEHVEYTELRVEISNEVNCGFYQSGLEQGAFLYVGNNKMYIKVSDLSCISDFVDAGLEKIDSFAN